MKRLSKPEQQFKELLQNLGFTVKFFAEKLEADFGCAYMQVPFSSFFLDFALLDKKIVFEINGHWHAPETSNLNSSQVQRKLTDFRKRRELEENNWTVISVPSSILQRETLPCSLQNLLDQLRLDLY